MKLLRVLLAATVVAAVAGVAYVQQNTESAGVRMADAAQKWANSLSAEQKQWVTTAARDVSAQEPKRGFALEHSAAARLEKIGVKIITDVDKPGFQKIADPYLDKLARDLGPHAEKIKNLIRAIN